MTMQGADTFARVGGSKSGGGDNGGAGGS